MNGPVICGVDNSSVAVGAIEVARQLARHYELPLVYAHVIDGTDDGRGAERLLHNAVAPEHAEIAIEHGYPADRLVTLARERRASFLVVGNHGPRSSLLGSVSADVSRRASCPVVVVPTTAAAPPSEAASQPEVRGGIVRFGLDHAVRRVA